MPDQIEHVREKAVVGAILTVGVASGTRSLDAFASWLLGAFGAALAVLIANIDSMGAYLPATAIQCAATLFLIAAIAGVLQKYIAAALIAGGEAGAEGRKLGAEIARQPGEELDLEVCIQELERVPGPIGWFLRRSLAKAKGGDLAASARTMVGWSTVQGFLVLLEAGLVLGAIGAIAAALGGWGLEGRLPLRPANILL